MTHELESDVLIAPEMLEPANPAEAFLDEIMDTMYEYAAAKRALNDFSTIQLGEDFLTEEVLLINDLSPPANREEAKQLSTYVSGHRKHKRSLIVVAKGAAQNFTWYESDDKDLEVKNLIAIMGVYETNTQVAQDESRPLEDRVDAATWVEAYDRQFAVSKLAKEMNSSLEDFLNQSPDRVLDLISYLRSDEYDPHEIRPFLVTTANILYDPSCESIIRNRIEAIDHHSGLFRAKFFDTIADCVDFNEATRQEALKVVEPETAEWLQFIAQTLGSELIFKLMASEPAEWPSPLQDCYEKCYRDFISDMKTDVSAIFEAYVEPQSFIVDQSEIRTMVDKSHPAQAKAKVAKKRRTGRGGGRVTTKAKVEDYVADEPETEQLPSFGRLAICSRQDNSYHIIAENDLQANGTAIIESVPTVQGYLKKYISDPNIKRDLSKMFASIVDQPYGNGASPMSGMKAIIKHPDGSESRGVRIWHLNPNKRADLSVGDVGRKTRVFYVTFDASDGERCISVIHVGNKNGLEKVRNSLSV